MTLFYQGRCLTTHFLHHMTQWSLFDITWLCIWSCEAKLSISNGYWEFLSDDGTASNLHHLCHDKIDINRWHSRVENMKLIFLWPTPSSSTDVKTIFPEEFPTSCLCGKFQNLSTCRNSTSIQDFFLRANEKALTSCFSMMWHTWWVTASELTGSETPASLHDKHYSLHKHMGRVQSTPYTLKH